MWVVVLCVAFGATVEIHGNWSDSSVKDETLIFFEENAPELLNKVATVLEDVQDSEGEVLRALRKYVHQPLFGLLNLSLALRYYHPKASIRKPIDRKPVLRGWSVEFDSGAANTREYRDFTKKFALYLSTKTAEERLNALFTVATNLSALGRIVNQLPNNSSHVSDFSPLSGNPVKTVNGRSVRETYFGVLEALLEEYRHQRFFTFSPNVLKLESSRKVTHFSDFPKDPPKLEAHDYKKNFQKWAETPNVDNQNSWELLKCQKPLLNVHIYFTLKNPESPALLEWALDLALARRPANLYLILVSDLTNETERQITYSWLQSVSSLGTRNACIFMIDGFKRGFKKAYRATMPSVKWRNLIKQTANSTIEKKFLSLQEYARSHGINDVAVSINGEFLQTRPLLQSVNNEALAVAQRIRGATLAGAIKWNQDFDIIAWYKSEGLIWNNATYPLSIGTKNHVSLHSFSLSSIEELACKLERVAVMRRGVPVVKSEDLPKLNLSLEERRFLRYSGGSETTIVGGYVFKRVLSEDEIDYAAAYTNHSLCVYNLESNLTTSQLFMCLFLRSTLDLEQVYRRPVNSAQFNQNSMIQVGNETGLVWEMTANIMELDSRDDIIFAKYVADSGAATVIIHPFMKPGGPNQKLITSCVRPVVFENRADVKRSHLVRIPSEWICTGSNQIIVEKIIHYGFSDYSDRVIKIGGIERRPTSDAGYFQVMFPVGSYGVKHALETSFNVDSLLPVPRFYSLLPITKDKSSRDDSLNVLVYVDNANARMNISTLLYTITENTTAHVKLWIVGAAKIPKGIDGEVLPNYYPYVYRKPRDTRLQWSCWKFALADVYLPLNSQFLFVDTNVVFRGDASRFQRIDMTGMAAAAPVMTDSWWNKRNAPWMSHELRRDRMDRPYHSTSIVFVDMRNWIEMNAGSIFRKMLFERIRAHLCGGAAEQEIFNVMQLNLQILSLPEEIAYCTAHSPRNLANKAFAVVMCSRESSRVTGIKLGQLRHLARQKFHDDEL